MKCISSLAARFQACLLTPEAMGFTLTFNLTKNLIRSGLKFNHWLKEVIPGAIGGWCPLCLIAPYLFLSPSLSEIRNAYLFLQFHSFFFFLLRRVRPLFNRWLGRQLTLRRLLNFVI